MQFMEPGTESYTLITGASKGLGQEMALECASRGWNLILVALPGTGLEQLCQELRLQFGIRAVAFECDLTQTAELERVAAWVTTNYKVNRLINNVGLGGTLKFEDATAEYLNRIIDLNIRPATLLTYYMLPLLKQHRKSLILNIASIAAFGPVPYKTIYPASKAFIYSFSRGLNKELRGTGVRVAVVAPGPFSSNPEVMTRILKQGIFCRMSLVHPRDITRQSLTQAENGKAVIVPGLMNKINRIISRLIPDMIRLHFASRLVRKELK